MFICFSPLVSFLSYLSTFNVLFSFIFFRHVFLLYLCINFFIYPFLFYLQSPHSSVCPDCDSPCPEHSVSHLFSSQALSHAVLFVNCKLLLALSQPSFFLTLSLTIFRTLIQSHHLKNEAEAVPARLARVRHYTTTTICYLSFYYQ